MAISAHTTPSGVLATGLPAPPHSHLAERERIRGRIEARIEAWIALLDRLDGDADLEPYLAGSYNEHYATDSEGGLEDDEWSLGWNLEGDHGSWDGRTDCELADEEMGAAA